MCVPQNLEPTARPPICHDKIALKDARKELADWRYINTGIGNGLVLNRHQAITWTNDNLVHWQISPGFKLLNKIPPVCIYVMPICVNSPQRVKPVSSQIWHLFIEDHDVCHDLWCTFQGYELTVTLASHFNSFSLAYMSKQNFNQGSLFQKHVESPQEFFLQFLIDKKESTGHILNKWSLIVNSTPGFVKF